MAADTDGPAIIVTEAMVKFNGGIAIHHHIAEDVAVIMTLRSELRQWKL